MILSVLVNIDELMVLGSKHNSHGTLTKSITVIPQEVLMLLAFTVTYAVSCNAINIKPAKPAAGFLYNSMSSINSRATFSLVCVTLVSSNPRILFM